MKRRDLLKSAVLGGAATLAFPASAAPAASPRGTGDLGLVIERATGSALIVETTGRSILARVEGRRVGALRITHVVLNRGVLHAAEHAGPVSYTHLRAHETPEPPVCRLLLEKKKHTPPPPH